MRGRRHVSWPERTRRLVGMLAVVWACVGGAQVPPYDVRPQAEAPYYRVRYEPSAKPGELSVPVTYTAWLPEGVKSLRGVLVHQHGCGEGSCKSGLTQGAAWLAALPGTNACAAAVFAGDPRGAAWLPNEAVARAWRQYVQDTAVADATPPPAPHHVRLAGTELTWDAQADLESGLAGFLVERDGALLAAAPEAGKNPFGRPLFQGLQYSDTPLQPLVRMRFADATAWPGRAHAYRVMSVNTAGLRSQPSEPARPAAAGSVP